MIFNNDFIIRFLLEEVCNFDYPVFTTGFINILIFNCILNLRIFHSLVLPSTMILSLVIFLGKFGCPVFITGFITILIFNCILNLRIFHSLVWFSTTVLSSEFLECSLSLYLYFLWLLIKSLTVFLEILVDILSILELYIPQHISEFITIVIIRIITKNTLTFSDTFSSFLFH